MKNENSASDFTPVSPYLKHSNAWQTWAEQRLVNALSAPFENGSWATCRQFGSLLGLTFFGARKRRRELAIDNVQKAMRVNRALATRIARRASQNWGMTSCEFLHLPNASASEISAYVDLEGREHLDAALSEGKGAILLMAHIGNWELMAARIAQDFDTSAIVRPLSNGVVQEHMSQVRRGAGLSLISKYSAARPALKFLRQGGALCLLPDRHAGSEGALLPLFGRLTSFETAPAKLAAISGAPIVPVFGLRRAPWLADGRIVGRILPGFHVRQASRGERVAAVEAGTREVIARLEEVVRTYPDQWSWMLRRWRAEDLFCYAHPSSADHLPRRGRTRHGSGVSSWINPKFAAETAPEN